MATAGVNRMMLWTDLEGRELDRGWRLGRLVRPEGRTAWFAATSADGKPLMVSITEALNDEEDLLARLRAAADIHSPHVVAVRESFLTHLDDKPVVLAAMEPTEENLGDVLRERTLSVAEAQGLLEALVQGLAAVHANGMTHARMEPASVLAMGDTIKLRSDCLLLGHSGSAGFANAAAENVRGLGRIVTQAVTRRIPASENDVVLQLLPEPMARAVRRALSGNASITEIAALAGVVIVSPAKASRPGPVIVTPAPVAAEPPVREPLPATPSPTPVSTDLSPDKPVPMRSEPEKSAPKVIPVKAGEACVEALPKDAVGESAHPELLLRPAERQAEEEAAFTLDDDEAGRRMRPSARWIIAAALLVVLATGWALYALIHRGSSTQTAQLPARTSVAPPRAKPVATTTTHPNRSATTTVAVSTPGWRVVAYTYRHEAQADQKAQSLAQRYPQLSPGVFTLHGGAPYLVTLGGVMSKANAEALRRNAIRMGLPHDTYAQNYR
ncbi:MAG: SPOR domain-containing protein [Acidobacteriaceae bacterium]